MRKKCFILFILLLLLFGTSCGLLDSRLEKELPLQVGLLTDGNPVEDAGVNQAVWDCLQQLKTEISGLEVRCKIPGTDGSYANCSADLVAQGCTLIICIDGSMADAITDIASANPQILFAIMDCEEQNLPNVVSLCFALEEAAYLAGYVAAKVSVSERLACLHGRLTEETEQLLASFMAGAKAANGDVLILRRNLLVPKTRERLAAEELVANGADVFFHVDGSADSAVIGICEENGVWSVGIHREPGKQLSKSMVAVAEKQVGTVVRQLVLEAAEGTLKAGKRTLHFANEGLFLVVNDDVVSEKILGSINKMRDRIVAGEITIPTTFEKLLEKYPELAEETGKQVVQ